MVRRDYQEIVNYAKHLINKNIDILEKEIDENVHRLYGLSDSDKKVIENYLWFCLHPPILIFKFNDKGFSMQPF